MDRRTVDKLVKKYFVAAKIKDTSKHNFYTMRHTRVVLMLEDEFDISKVKYVLGHKIYNQYSYICSTYSKYWKRNDESDV